MNYYGNYHTVVLNIVHMIVNTIIVIIIILSIIYNLFVNNNTKRIKIFKHQYIPGSNLLDDKIEFSKETPVVAGAANFEV